MKVFVIEQRRETLERIVRLLKDMRHEVTTFTDGREGAESVTTLKPDLILIDADINQGLGLKIAERLKREESTMLIPVILLTTPYKSKEFIEGAMAARIDGFLFLPFDEMDFHTKVHVGMRLKAYADETVAQKDTLSELSDTIAERDEELRAKDDHIA
ncbi:MAG: response regulator, partial [Spirochaetota bacterium]